MAGFMKSAMNLLGIKKDGSEGGSFEGVVLEDFLKEVAMRAGYDLEFTKTQEGSEDEAMKFEISGDEAEEFLGDSSEMLESLAHLSIRFLRKTQPLEEGEPRRFQRIEFNCGDFREQKIKGLQDLAASKRQKVLDNDGKPAYINALGPSERKAIHTFITDSGDMVSESIGNGYFKRIRIRLKDDNRKHSDGGGRRRSKGGGNQGRNRNRDRKRGNGNREFNGDSFNKEPNGNVLAPEKTYDDIDENIGNKLAPGEEPPFSFDSYDNDTSKS